MRPYHYQKIIDLMQSVMDAQDSGHYATCQEGAEALINFIASLGDMGEQTIILLEQYFELLYKTNIGEVKTRFLYKHLSKILNAINIELKPTRLEIAFISHMAAMSDSIESIYLAAKEDPNCDAFFIPVPYYKHDAQGKPETLCYEGAEYYSKNIECTYWELYDIEARRPDVIFTFNAYDDNNLISSIHPNFYNQKLKQFTEKLIYLPYTGSVRTNVAHVCLYPACVHADHVILSTKKVRDHYENTFKNKYGNNFGSIKNKFLALGSPKHEKAIKDNKANYDIPSSWQKIINGKKIIFYNTTIGQLMKWNETYIDLLRKTLKTFKEHRNDVAIWWRPHPLIIPTLKSMRPQFMKDYLQLVDDFKEYGVYDESPNLHRAIACSDACFSEPNSVYTLYKVTGKPIQLQYTDKELTLPSFVKDILTKTQNLSGNSIDAINEFELVNATTTGNKIVKYIKANML